MKRTIIAWAILVGLVVMSAQTAQAASLGIALDDFLAQFQAFIVGLGMLLGIAGLSAWIYSALDSQYGGLLSGSISFFVKAGLLGGGLTILGAVGLVSGAVLPL